VWDEDLKEYNNPLPRWWLNLFYLTLAWGVLYLLAYPGLGAWQGLLHWTQVSQYDSEVASAEAQYSPMFARFAATDLTTLAQDPKAMQVGARLFSNACAACHGSDARGARGFPNLRDDDWLYGNDPATIETTITNGRQGMMPAWGAILAEPDQHDVTAYVERLAGRQTDGQAAQHGATIFSTYCAACHGAEGKGNPLLGAPNLTDDIWLHGGSTARIAESIAKGRQSLMPAHGALLGAAKTHVLAAYVLGMRDATAPRHVED
jgi:cytochrome c oxidase cbb3-type subunit III